MKKKFKLEIVKESEKALFVSPVFSDSGKSLFQEFSERYLNIDPVNLFVLLDSIDRMAETGIQSSFFKYQRPKYVYRFIDSGTLRLYCLKYNDIALVIGGGGVKPRNVRNLISVPELELAVKILEAIQVSLDKSGIKFSELHEHLDDEFEIEL